MTGLGQTPFGSARFGGLGQMVIRGAVAITTHEVLVDFDKAPQTLDSGGYESASNPKNWAIAAVDPTRGGARPATPVPTYAPTVIGVGFDDAFPKQVRVGVDLPLEVGVFYDLTAQPAIEGAACETLTDERTWRVLARHRTRVSPVPRSLLDRYTDLRTTPDGAVITAAGDLDSFGGLEALQLRILRRITTALGGFVMLVGYGVDVQIKSTLRPGDVQALANAITAQLTQEPDVQQGSAVVRLVEANGVDVVAVTITVSRREGRDRTIIYEFPRAS